MSIPKAGSPGEELFELHCKAYGLTPVREYRFHPDRRWRFDFAFPDRLVALEVEGGAWIRSRHTSPKGFASDMVKYNTAAALNWKVFRATTEMVESGYAIDLIRKVLK